MYDSFALLFEPSLSPNKLPCSVLGLVSSLKISRYSWEASSFLEGKKRTDRCICRRWEVVEWELRGVEGRETASEDVIYERKIKIKFKSKQHIL